MRDGSTRSLGEPLTASLMERVCLGIFNKKTPEAIVGFADNSRFAFRYDEDLAKMKRKAKMKHCRQQENRRH